MANWTGMTYDWNPDGLTVRLSAGAERLSS
jgi:hypothetical protein